MIAVITGVVHTDSGQLYVSGSSTQLLRTGSVGEELSEACHQAVRHAILVAVCTVVYVRARGSTT